MRAEDFITKHTSPSGVKTNMSPTDDDYDINYGKDGSVAKFRKAQGLDVKTGAEPVNEWTDPGPPCVHCGLPHGGHRVAFKRKNPNLRFINPDDEVQDLDIVGAEDHEFEPSKNYTPLSQDEAELVGYSVLSGSHPEDIYQRINRARQQISRVGKGARKLRSVKEDFQLDEGLGDWIEKKMDDLLNPYNNHNYGNRPDAVASAVKAAPANLPDDVAERLINEFLKKKEHEAALAQAARAQGTTTDKIRPYLKYFVGNFVDRWRRIPIRDKQRFWKDLALGVFRLIMFILQALAKGKR